MHCSGCCLLHVHLPGCSFDATPCSWKENGGVLYQIQPPVNFRCVSSYSYPANRVLVQCLLSLRNGISGGCHRCPEGVEPLGKLLGMVGLFPHLAATWSSCPRSGETLLFLLGRVCACSDEVPELAKYLKQLSSRVHNSQITSRPLPPPVLLFFILLVYHFRHFQGSFHLPPRAPFKALLLFPAPGVRLRTECLKSQLLRLCIASPSSPAFSVECGVFPAAFALSLWRSGSNKQWPLGLINHHFLCFWV